MYYMHWTLDDIRKLDYRQLHWITEALADIKRKEARALRRKR